jgi:pyoverdine/dityrosine biosynthesis protein Dit1
MDFSNEGQSFYHRFQASCLRDTNGGLMDCTEQRRQWFHQNWNLVLSGNQPLPGNDDKIHRSSNIVQHNRAAVMVNNQLQQPGETPAFDEFFVQLIVSQADPCSWSRSSSVQTETESTTQKVVDLFDSHLRYEGKDDRWAESGRPYFTERVLHFTSRRKPIQFCLPAFPCKSSNPDKVTGRVPDRGEELALERLHEFIQAVEQIYDPGAKLWIISDGHVFSDCIGVDDAEVDVYGQKLEAMNLAVGQRMGNVDRVGFKSLTDLFQLGALGSDRRPSNLADRLKIPTVDHHVNTEVTADAELCRRILMAGCGPQASAVRAQIESKDAAITALYRGFSRFMLEDLEHHPHTMAMTRSQQKKLSSKVAFEMILVGPCSTHIGTREHG